MDGNLQVAYDSGPNLVDAWNEIFVTNDMLNPRTGEVDPRHMYGTSNFDIFRWQSLENGTQRTALGTFINSLIMPGIPLVSTLLGIDLLFTKRRVAVVLWRRTELLSLRQRRFQLSIWVRSSLLRYQYQFS